MSDVTVEPDPQPADDQPGPPAPKVELIKPNQQAAMHAQFKRLGISGDADRDARLIYTQALAEVDQLTSSKQLTVRPGATGQSTGWRSSATGTRSTRRVNP